MITFDLNWQNLIAIVLGIVLPLLVGLITTRLTESKWKGLLLSLLSVVAAALGEISAALESGATFDLATWLITALATLVAGQATYSAIWKPTGATTALQRVGTAKDDDYAAAIKDDYAKLQKRADEAIYRLTREQHREE